MKGANSGAVLALQQLAAQQSTGYGSQKSQDFIGGYLGRTFGFLWVKRWPTTAESAAMGLLISGVISCASAHRSKK